jgi:hypothetical protein
MADASHFRDKAEQALRLARDTTDPMLQNSLAELALEYRARAAAIDGLSLGQDRKMMRKGRLGWRPFPRHPVSGPMGTF